MNQYIKNLLLNISKAFLITFIIVGMSSYALNFYLSNNNSDKDLLSASELQNGLNATGVNSKVFIYNLRTGASCPTGWAEISVAKNGAADQIMKEFNEFGVFFGGDHSFWGGGYSPYLTYNYISNATYGTQSDKFCVFFY